VVPDGTERHLRDHFLLSGGEGPYCGGRVSPEGPRNCAAMPRRNASPSSGELFRKEEAPLEALLRPPPDDRDFQYTGGIHLVDSVLWFDAERRNDLCFLSHAHGGVIGKHRRVLATEETLRLLTRGVGRVDALTSPYGRSFVLGALRLELRPSGHMLGAAQLLVMRDERRIVYTSTINVIDGLTTPKADVVPCDALALPAQYALPMYRFPPREEVLADIRAFIERCFEEKATPVLIANQAGASQELMEALGRSGFRFRVHRSIYEVGRVYRKFGIRLTGMRRFQGTPARDEVVVFPPILRRHQAIRKLRKHRSAILSGRAVEEGFAERHRVDKAFVFSDAADYAGLLAFVEATGARDVYLSGGVVDQFSETLRERGHRVFSLFPPQQLSLFGSAE
jgi:putative mRNA 3-end processing factor